MTKKRKVNYADLLREQQEGEAATPPAVPPAVPPADAQSPGTPSAATPDSADPTAPEVQPEPVAPRAKSGSKDRAPRRRAADRASSPVDLASALNERADFERKRRGDTPASPVPAIPADEAVEEKESGAAAESREPSAESASPLEESVPAASALPFRDRVRARTGQAELLLFRIGRELFATALSSVEEAVELAEIRPIPEMSREMLGVFDLRGRMIPIYSPAVTLGVPLAESPRAALVVRSGDRRMALAVDDVEDVLDIDLTAVRAAPGTDDGDGVLLGVARHGRSLVAVLDGEALVNACLSDRVPETA